jgi:hypothetical protein
VGEEALRLEGGEFGPIVELLASTTSVSALLPTGVPVWMYSSRVLTSISRCLAVMVMPKILSRWALASVLEFPGP